MSKPSGNAYKAYLRGEIKSTRDITPERYRQWRQSIPFTDAQIASALRQLAAEVRSANAFIASRFDYWAKQADKGTVTGKCVNHAAQVLCRMCAICGAKSLYLVGYEGRCSKHKLIKDAHERERFGYSELRSTARERHERDFTAREKERASLHSTRRAKTVFK